LKKQKMKHGKRFFLVVISILGVMLFSCNDKEMSYETYVAKELASGERNDSLIYGIHFGMTEEEFKSYCTGMNLQKRFMPNPRGSAVRLALQKGFGAPVVFDFFPVLHSDKAITKVTASMKYRDFSYYDKTYDIGNLVIEAEKYFEDGYGGNKFIAIPHENILLKHMYVKIDGNRKILLKPTFEGQELQIEFEDLDVDLE